MTQLELQLIEKITKAKMKLKSLKQDHTGGCYRNDSTGYPASCKCGADAINAVVRAISKELDLLDIVVSK